MTKNYFQLESGWKMDRSSEKDFKTTNNQFLSLLLRYGLIDRLELRLEWGGFYFNEETTKGLDYSDSGSGDTAVGTRIYLFSQSGFLPQTALDLRLNLPTGKDPFTAGRNDPSIAANMSHSLNDRFSLAYNFGVSWNTQKEAESDFDTNSFFIYSTALGIQLSDRTSTFVEFYGDTSICDSGATSNYFDTGVAFLAHDQLQLDVFAGLGLSDSATDWFISVGFSWLIFH
jgi:hypothetical protein